MARFKNTRAIIISIKRGNIMNLFKRTEKKDEIPKLPELPKLPDFPSINDLKQARDFSPLPSLQEHQDISAETKTSASEKRTIEIPEISYDRQAPQFSHALPEKFSEQPPSHQFSKESLFIKIDKFQEAIQRFEEIKRKISEIEISIQKIKEIKEREESEIRQWEAEIQQVKEKISSIDLSLFNKI